MEGDIDHRPTDCNHAAVSVGFALHGSAIPASSRSIGDSDLPSMQKSTGTRSTH
jgi:hypothetical protein